MYSTTTASLEMLDNEPDRGLVDEYRDEFNFIDYDVEEHHQITVCR